jgi:hypothetical protein
MPPHRHKPHHHPAPVPPTAIRPLLSAERLDPFFRPFLPDPADRAFITRCILEQGPIHHRCTSFALLSLAATLLERTGGFPDEVPSGQTIPVPLRLPPHLAPEREEDNAYPLSMPLAPLEAIAPQGTPAFDALVDCLLDGPAHHALANAALVCAFGVLLERFPARSREDKP